MREYCLSPHNTSRVGPNRLYGHVLPSTQRAAANKLDAMLGEAADSNQEAEQDQGDQPTEDEDE